MYTRNHEGFSLERVVANGDPEVKKLASSSALPVILPLTASGSLAAMNWRRGLLLSAINLAVAISMVLMMEARDLRYALSSEEIMAKAAAKYPPKPPESLTSAAHSASPEQVEQTVSFDPCTMWVHYPAQVVVLQGADLPAVALAGWEEECPAYWSLAGRLRGNMTWPPTPLWMERQREIDIGLCLFITAQWLFLGSFPLRRVQKWWAEPGAFITVCAVLAGAFALLPVADGLARLPALFAMLAWFWWVGLLIWKLLQLGWRMATARRLSS